MADDPARAGLDFDRRSHAGSERKGFALDLHPRSVECAARRIDRLLALRFVGRSVRRGQRAWEPSWRFVARDGVG